MLEQPLEPRQRGSPTSVNAAIAVAKSAATDTGAGTLITTSGVSSAKRARICASLGMARRLAGGGATGSQSGCTPWWLSATSLHR